MSNKNYQNKVEPTLKGLKDFQTKTVDYLYRRLYEEGQQRMLVADEVGLGKTVVAKGLIAKRYNDEEQKGGLHIVYICSNQALAKQNLRKLNFTNDNDIEKSNLERLIFLATVDNKEKFDFKISTLTPSTSFNLKKSWGKIAERVLLYSFFKEYSDFSDKENGLRFLFKGQLMSGEEGKKLKGKELRERFKELTEKANYSINRTVKAKFRKHLRETIVSEETLPEVCHALGKKEVKVWFAMREICGEMKGLRNPIYEECFLPLVKYLRERLTIEALENLNADIFILDEFQRFKTLLDSEQESQAAQIAHKVFSIDKAKVLLLSATPFKPYTTHFDRLNGEDHYDEFRKVLNFLSEEKGEKKDWSKYEENRKRFFEFIQKPDFLLKSETEAIAVKNHLQEEHYKLIARTERAIVLKKEDASPIQNSGELLSVTKAEIQNFIAADRITQALNQELPNSKINTPIDFAKSAPYPLSFLTGYQLHKKLVDNFSKVKSVCAKNSDAWIDLNTVKNYQKFGTSDGTLSEFPNAKLNQLLQHAVANEETEGYKLLWLPPTLPYYPLLGAYENSVNFSKVLVFSRWVMVPRMISTLVSYEAERLSVGDKNTITSQEKAERKYFDKVRHPNPLLTFSTKKETDKEGNKTGDKEPQNMSNVCLLYPSPTLASLYNPSEFLGMTFSEIKELTQKKVEKKIKQLSNKNKDSKAKRDEDWYWALPIILDRENPEFLDKYIYEIDKLADAQYKSAAKKRHMIRVQKAFRTPEDLELGEMPDDLASVVAEMTLNGPSISVLRSLQGLFPENGADLFSHAFNIADSFLTLFNKPESIAVVRLTNGLGPYWKAVLRYTGQGNLQAVIDEFMSLLYSCENLHSPQALSEHFADVITLQTAGMDVEGLPELKKKSNKKSVSDKKMRTHFAVSFGNQQLDSESGTKRITNLREVFNSPFRPFVMATTSIGQEGLDFHYYCRKIMHWNLPYNAIDLEQREGRINRYKGFHVRKNIAKKYKNALSQTNTNENIWERLFAAAEEGERADKICDLIPFWHVNTEDAVKIERIVPLHPFSKDQAHFESLLRVLTLYRLTFGQPRQEELIKTMNEANLTEEEQQKIMESMIQVLAPVVREK